MSAAIFQLDGDHLEAATNREELSQHALEQLRLRAGELVGHNVFVLALPKQVRFADFCASLARRA